MERWDFCNKLSWSHEVIWIFKNNLPNATPVPPRNTPTFFTGFLRLRPYINKGRIVFRCIEGSVPYTPMIGSWWNHQDDKKMLAELQKSCSQKAADWEERKSSRQKEQIALQERYTQTWRWGVARVRFGVGAFFWKGALTVTVVLFQGD